MSQRNGDKARFHRLRKRKVLLRKNIRELPNALSGERPVAENTAVRK